MNKDSCTTTDHEVSLFDIFRILWHHGWKIALFTAGVTVLAGIYFVKRPELAKARMLLSGANYEIGFLSNDSAWTAQHLALIHSPEFCAKVARRMADEKLLADPAASIDGIFYVSAPRYSERSIYVSASMPKMEDAIRALSIWADEYGKAVTRYRAKKLHTEFEKNIHAQEQEIVVWAAVSDWMKQQWIAKSAGGQAAPIEIKAASNKVVEAYGNLLLQDSKKAFYEKVVQALKDFSEKGTDGYPTDSMANVRDYAMDLILQNKNELLGQPAPFASRQGRKAKILVVFLLALGLSCAVALVGDWMRRQAVCKG